MRADEVRKGDELWGRTVEESKASAEPGVWCLQLNGTWFYVPCDAELDVVRPPQMIMVELPKEAVYWLATHSGTLSCDDYATIGEACRKALAEGREAVQ